MVSSKWLGIGVKALGRSGIDFLVNLPRACTWISVDLPFTIYRLRATAERRAA